MKIITPYSGNNPELIKALEISETAVQAFARGFDSVKLDLALRAYDFNPVGACEAAWGVETVAKTGTDFIRYVAPTLDTDERGKKTVNTTAKDLCCGGFIGAGIGALIGGGIGGGAFWFIAPIAVPVGIAIGGACGGVAGIIITAGIRACKNNN